MLLISLPMFVLVPLLQNPAGALGVALSFFPLSAPMVMVMRLTIPPGVPLWQPMVAAVTTLAATVGFVWVAGRIFRVGILMQGKGANYAAVLAGFCGDEIPPGNSQVIPTSGAYYFNIPVCGAFMADVLISQGWCGES